MLRNWRFFNMKRLNVISIVCSFIQLISCVSSYFIRNKISIYTQRFQHLWDVKLRHIERIPPSVHSIRLLLSGQRPASVSCRDSTVSPALQTAILTLPWFCHPRSTCGARSVQLCLDGFFLWAWVQSCLFLSNPILFCRRCFLPFLLCQTS